MRIISGTHKGRVVRPGKFFKDRPTTDIAKESLFNILNNQYSIEESNVLDLFTGSGSISYEFASRGASSVLSVDANYKYVEFIKSTARDFSFDNIIAVRSDVFRFVKGVKQQFDFIFADPPFGLNVLDQIPDLIFEHKILTDDGLFILEHPQEFNFSKHPNFKELRKYGRVNFSFFTDKKV
jgi:16S rRNA (guanine966-N2)-methyltransferase